MPGVLFTFGTSNVVLFLYRLELTLNVIHPVRNSTLVVVDLYKPKFVVFLCGSTSLLVPLKHFTLLRMTNKSLIYPGNIPFTALKINMVIAY